MTFLLLHIHLYYSTVHVTSTHGQNLTSNVVISLPGFSSNSTAQVSWDEIILTGSVSSLLGVASISDVTHKDLSHKSPTEEEVS